MMNQETLHQLFNYDQKTGKLTHNMPYGREVGCLNYAGYRVTLIKRKNYRVPRLIWMWMTGEFPVGTIDHIDRDRDNNTWTNLRDATKQEQSLNRSAVGVRMVPSGNYEASIQHNGIRVYLGCAFPTFDLAKAAYDTRKAELAGTSEESTTRT